MDYSVKQQINASFSDAVSRAKAALAEEGFGILTEIDVKETLKKKLNIDRDNYIILGACNPPFASEALQAEIEIGLFLPCNVIVYEDNGKVFVSAIRPTIAMQMIDNQKLSDVAKKVEQKLTKVINRLGMKDIKKTEKVFDLVCGMELNPENAKLHTEYKGEVYYFCSMTCKNHFVGDPEKYAG